MDIRKGQILKPRDVWWERNGIFNPAVVSFNQKIYMVYRAVGADHISRFGLAVSDDGQDFSLLPEPWYEGEEANIYHRLGVEDPRAVVIDDRVHITFTGASVYMSDELQRSQAPSLNTPGVPWRIRVCGLTTRDFNKIEPAGQLVSGIDSKNGVLLPKKIRGDFILFHRISPRVFISKSRRFGGFEGGSELLRPQEPWEELKIGFGPPPLELDEGWLTIYHGVGADHTYRAGLALLEAFSASTVIKKTRKPFLTPTETWEKKGFVKNVVFPTGALIRNGKIHIYYGAADASIGKAVIDINDALKALG